MGAHEAPHLYKMAAACEIMGVKPGTLRKWDKDGLIKTVRTPGKMRLFDLSSIDKTITSKPATKAYGQKCVVLYSRVSSPKQKQDLERQKEYLRASLPNQYTESEIINTSDIASGINFKRPGLLSILGKVTEGKVSVLVVASRDRLARFGFELIEWMCSKFGTTILVLDAQDTTPESELGKDLMAIVQVYCCRWNGRRRYAVKSQVTEVEVEAEPGAEEKVECLGRLCEVLIQQDDCSVAQPKKQIIKKQIKVAKPIRHRVQT